MRQEKRVLLLQGGAKKGVFTAGVLHGLAEELGLTPEHFDTILGMSAGAANGFIWTTGKLDLLEQVWMRFLTKPEFLTLDWRRCIRERRMPLNLGYLAEVIEFVHGHLPEIHTPVYAGVSNLTHGRVEFVRIGGPHAVRHLTTACAVPLMTLPRLHGRELFYDGSMARAIPIDRACAHGGKVLFIGTVPPHEPAVEYHSVLRWIGSLGRRATYDMFSAAPEDERIARSRLQQLVESGRAYAIYPPDAGVPGGGLAEAREHTEAGWSLGLDIGRRVSADVGTFLDL